MTHEQAMSYIQSAPRDQMRATVNRHQFISCVNIAYKASLGLEFSTVSYQGFIVLRMLPKESKIEVFGRSYITRSYSEVLSEFDDENEKEDVVLVYVGRMLKIMSRWKKETIKITLDDNDIIFNGDGKISSGRREFSLNYGIEDINMMKEFKGEPRDLDTRFIEGLRHAEQFTQKEELTQDASGVGLYKGYLIARTQHIGITHKVSSDESLTLDKTIQPRTISNLFPRATQDLTLSFMIYKDRFYFFSVGAYGLTVNEAALLNYPFKHQIGDILLSLPKRLKTRITFNRRELADAVSSTLAFQPEIINHTAYVFFEFLDESLVTLNCKNIGVNETFSKTLEIETDAIPDNRIITFNPLDLKALITFCKEEEIELFTDQYNDKWPMAHFREDGSTIYFAFTTKKGEGTHE